MGDDVTNILGITKYEPPESNAGTGLTRATSKKKRNPHFKEYTDIQNFKYYPDAFNNSFVHVTEKLHGTSARYAVLPREPHYFWEVWLKWLGLLPKYEFCFGSRRVQLQHKPRGYRGFYPENVYEKIANQYDFASKLKPGETLYGEIVGHGIQGGYDYGHKPGEYTFYAYDYKSSERFYPPRSLQTRAKELGCSAVPELYAGPFDKELIDGLRSGDSTVGNQKVREGIVVRSISESTDARFGRKLLKWINDDYYLNQSNTDFH